MRTFFRLLFPNHNHDRTYSLTITTHSPPCIIHIYIFTLRYPDQQFTTTPVLFCYIFLNTFFVLLSMASSDEEGEIVPNCVTDYLFVNDKEELVSFTTLPLLWSPNESLVQTDIGVFLLASVDDGLQKIYKRVVAWRFDLSFVKPEIYVLSKDKNWIVLQKPRKCFENTIRSILVTIYWLHFLKKNTVASRKFVWNYLLKALSSFELKPCENDVSANCILIGEVVKRDKDLAKIEDLHTYIEKPSKYGAFPEDVQIRKKSKFIVDMNDDVIGDDGECFDGDGGLYDHVCAICDNGGQILSCQGRCMRSFHATRDAAGGENCSSLGYNDAQVKAIPTFLCANCKYQQHQCFICGNMGSSDTSSSVEVFPCISATCGHFYHPECVAKMLQPANRYQTEELRLSIVAGESFTCPAHKCFVCHQGEDKKVMELQFALCRRCPKAYHRKCLPRSISFEYNYEKNIAQRAWDGLLPKRILIYCMDHEILSELATPARDHVKFPDVSGQPKALNLELHSSKERAMQMVSTTSKIFETFATKNPNMLQRVEKGGCSASVGDSTQTIKRRCAGPDFDSLRKRKRNDEERKSAKENIGSSLSVFSKAEGKSCMKNNSSISLETHPVKSKRHTASGIVKNATEEHVTKNAKTSCLSAQAEMEKRILDLMKESTCSFNHEEFIRRQRLLATNGLFSESSLDIDITIGKVEGSVEAIRIALKKLDEGCSIEDAKAVCEPDVLNQIFHWKRKLGVYLAPFLHGKRYTSYGRHFTKVDKLKEVVNRLHCYVQNGDTIVDFCCGSNDFSLLMREKLEKTGKQCFFKNYDLFIPKNDFSFEKRDWMSIKLEELPDSSQLIMGLNPPFGVKASLAHRFIFKALEFRPKLLILITPKETKRLDIFSNPYDLIWEDEQILSGKSFYLPGSIDMHDKQLEDWNLKAPPLYLWSRPDWTVRHNEIARQHGHIVQQQLHMIGNNLTNYLEEEDYDCYQDYSYLCAPGDISCTFNGVTDVTYETEPQEAGSNTLNKVDQSYIHRDDIDIGSKNNLNEMNYDGRGQTERLIQGDLEGSTPSDVSTDIELSSPSYSPICSNALHEVFGSPEEENKEKASQDKEKTLGQDFPPGLENEGFQTSYPIDTERKRSSQTCYPIDTERNQSSQTGHSTVAERRHSFQPGTQLGNYWWPNMDMPSQGYTGNFTYHSGQKFFPGGRQVNAQNNWKSQQYPPVMQRNQNPSSRSNTVRPNFNPQFQNFGSSSSIQFSNYSQTSKVRGSDSYSLAYRPEHPRFNKM
ncbi:protein ENHANCED DOWNY MILDEW 2-like isoform X2 [Humulus lupulus]|uniref:protein ENHANCED DOWNY MILDEW 2-like isoform X2 n=1 Tax=Humulus lupulus TaxID=3486 RepID=UPI002B40F673|nr:protein ENHANCED DOWNY MILDEW 2-like isoform X2 [Humulus lupulus]